MEQEWIAKSWNRHGLGMTKEGTEPAGAAVSKTCTREWTRSCGKAAAAAAAAAMVETTKPGGSAPDSAANEAAASLSTLVSAGVAPGTNPHSLINSSAADIPISAHLLRNRSMCVGGLIWWCFNSEEIK